MMACAYALEFMLQFFSPPNPFLFRLWLILCDCAESVNRNHCILVRPKACQISLHMSVYISMPIKLGKAQNQDMFSLIEGLIFLRVPFEVS
jgi:hypothetical protein